MPQGGVEMKIFVWTFLIILIAAPFLHPRQLNTPPFDELIPLAKKFVSALDNGEYKSAVKHFDETMAKAAPPEKMKEVWEMVTRQVGPLKTQKGFWTESRPDFDIVYVTCEFEKATLDIKVVFNKDKKIAGQFFVPLKPTKEYSPPLEYVSLDSFAEKEIEFGEEGWALPGTLSLPAGNGPFPVLVLLHGSGPNDRDQSIGPNKPFRDLAWGLASRDIAVLRFDKRTKVHGQKMVKNQDIKLTVYEETIEDALAAVQLLRDTDGIDADNIFVCGHSLGGMLIPRIAEADKTIQGFIIMAGPTRPMEDLLVDQIEYISLLDGELTDEEKATLDQIVSSAQMIKTLTRENAEKMDERFLGAGAEYWLDLKAYEPAEKAKTIERPVLILQGGRDYQVTMEDFKGWKNALSDKNNVEFKLYPAHNHLMIPGEGKGTPAEYEKVGHVDRLVIEDIAEWIKRVKQ